MVEAENAHYKKFFYKNRNYLKAQVYTWTNFYSKMRIILPVLAR